MTSTELTDDGITELRSAVNGPVFVRGDAELASEVPCFNTELVHDPDLVVGVTSADDVAAVVRFAAAHRLPVRIHATGHGAFTPATSGVIISTKRLDALSIDPETRMARIGAGLIWRPVIDAAAEFGLAPVTGSSVGVGAVGYTLGGGIGPLAHSHGYTSDWVRSFEVVTGSGEIVTADQHQHADLFWALRGGKVGLGVVTEMTLELAPLSSLYAGGLFFDGAENIEAALRAWSDWPADAPESATTSAAILQFPDMEFVPAPMRGRTLLHLRFAYPGAEADGERLVAPLRAAAAVYIDQVAQIPTTAVASIHNDPESGGPDWEFATTLTGIDQELVGRLLRHIGPEAHSPFLVTELRQLGGAAAVDTPEGTAVGGRDAAFTLHAIAMNPAFFATDAPRVANELSEDIAAWLAPVTNVNFAGNPALPDTRARAWTPDTLHRLDAVRATYDPDGVLA